ncbi:TnsA endonuclease N-terminal domain-containing protein [Viridibacillus arvi]|uniref:TnsA endonuclease N-terminal domain-containing protein n=1 Tax=Viridibacillus arvi TaxID=263475 RepID=UPI0036E5C5D4
MAKRKNEWTEEKIARYIKEGRGSGELSAYKPWLTNQDFASSGRTHRLKGWKTNRMHQLFSDIERNYFYLLEWTNQVIDIREQFPLNREKTIKISEMKNIAHSIDNKTKTPIVMTTDFLITVRNQTGLKYIARTIKPSEQLNNPRVVEKLEIEKEYWIRENVDWGIVTERDIPSIMWKNIEMIHRHYRVSDVDKTLTEMLYKELEQKKDGVLLSILNTFDDIYNLESGTALRLFKYLVARRYIDVGIQKKLDFRTNITNYRFYGYGEDWEVNIYENIQ